MESKFKVGDKVISIVRGVGIVDKIDKTEGCYPVYVEYFNSDRIAYNMDGKEYEQRKYPEIFKDGDIHPLLNVPVVIPKQKIKIEFDCVVNLYPKDTYIAGRSATGRYDVMAYADKIIATHCANYKAIATGISAKLIFEVEE